MFAIAVTPKFLLLTGAVVRFTLIKSALDMIDLGLRLSLRLKRRCMLNLPRYEI